MAPPEHDPPASDRGVRASEARHANDSGDSGAELVELNALLGRGTRYSGKLHFTGRVRIEGDFEGEIRGKDVLVIGSGANVEGDIEVAVCIVTGGRVDANIRASDAIELHAPAVVRGDLHAPNVFIDRGVQFEGNCKMAPLDNPPPLGHADADATAPEQKAKQKAEQKAEPGAEAGANDNDGVEAGASPTVHEGPAAAEPEASTRAGATED